MLIRRTAITPNSDTVARVNTTANPPTNSPAAPATRQLSHRRDNLAAAVAGAPVPAVLEVSEVGVPVVDAPGPNAAPTRASWAAGTSTPTSPAR